MNAAEIVGKPAPLASPEGREAARLTAASVATDGVRLSWADGITGTVPLRVLRYGCGCNLCGDTERGLRLAKLPDLPRCPAIAEIGVEGAGKLRIVWAEDRHQTILDGARLYAERPGSAGTRRARQTLWTAAAMDRLLPEFPVDAVLDPDDRGLFHALRALQEFGLVVLRGGAATPEGTERLTTRFGIVHETDYGRFFELRSVPDPQVAGATSWAQAPHTDEPFRYTPPGIFFLHCLEPGADMDGASIFVDGFAAAARLRAESPEAYDLLATEPMNFHRRHDGTVDLRCRARVLTLDEFGQVVGVRYNDRATGAFDQPLDRIDAAMDTAARFMAIVYDPAMQATVMLGAGDIAICDNHRVMHGRRAFDPNRKIRHLRSGHVDRDQVHSRLRLLARRFAPEEADLVLPAGVGV